MPFQPIRRSFAVLKQQMVIALHEFPDRNPFRAVFTIHAGRAEVVVFALYPAADILNIFGGIGLIALNRGNRAVHVRVVATADQRDGDLRIRHHKMQRGFEHRLFRPHLNKAERGFIVDQRAAAERVHDDDAHLMRGSRSNPLFAIREIRRAIAERHAFEIAFFDDFLNVRAGEMRREHGMAD